MVEHMHYFKVLKDDSVWGTTRVHAVMECQGVIDRHPCRKRLVKLVAYSELEKKGDERPTYFYRERVPAKMEVSNG